MVSNDTTTIPLLKLYMTPMFISALIVCPGNAPGEQGVFFFIVDENEKPSSVLLNYVL